MPVMQKSTPPGSSTGTLELKATKENAHSKCITSVAFNPVDGKTIVSGSWDKTIKVWDAVNFRPHVESEWESFTRTVEADDSDEEDGAHTWWRNKITGHEQSVKPSGGKCM
jgi:WD40 repeat protein